MAPSPPTTNTPSRRKLRRDAMAIARSGIRGVDPYRAVARRIRRRGSRLQLGDRRFSISEGGRVHVVALGKAASEMADAAIDRLGEGTRGIVATAAGYPRPRHRIRCVFGSHPVPDESSLAAGEALLEYVRALHPEDLLLFLLSGGGSAIAEVPAEGISLSEIARTTELLLHTDAPIEEITTVRRQLSRIKGGGLARAAGSHRQVTFALSDVVGDRPETIASGPTVPDPTGGGDAWEVVRRHGIDGRLPPAVRRRLQGGAQSRKGSPPPSRAPWGPFYLVATNRDALTAAAKEARRRGYRPWILSSRITGETKDVARVHAAILTSGPPVGRSPPRPWCLLSGGETTVSFDGGPPGRGGRNQEFALAAAEILEGASGVGLMSAGTDGIDGPTDAAGGWVDDRTMERARRTGVDIADALRRHDAYVALERLGGLLRWGPTGTNVMDLHIGLVARRRQVLRIEKTT